jgi:diaminohydroxyphosphoribosylaminopyrimidine deaminase/5-amino-6-(5-phosphoribosylamino)uracil reductase
LKRAYELAERGRGDTSPNPCVGALLTRGDVTLGEGFHRRKGSAHAEVEALKAAREAGNDVRGATAYVSLEPCDHTGATPPCTQALIAAGVSRVVAGTADPNPRTRGAGFQRLKDAGIEVENAADPAAAALIEEFAVAVTSDRPYVRLKMAASLDGYVAPQLGAFWLTGDAAREYVRDLRIAHDGIIVGAGTVRIDDPQLTVRPEHPRARPYVRIVACEDAPVPPKSRIFEKVHGYSETIVLAPAGLRTLFAPPAAVGDILFVGGPDARQLDLAEALRALQARGIASLLCEGGPTLAGRLLANKLVDRLDWLIAPRLLASERAVPALGHADVFAGVPPFAFERIEPLGSDLLLSARLSGEA